MYHKAIFLMGPTAVGKTALAMELARCLPVDLISVDSAMVYRGLDIGTGKPTRAELLQFPHSLIDICDPSQPYSVAQFCIDARNAMKESWQRERIPLLVGGTMLYFRALQFGIAALPCADGELRLQIMRQAQEQGWPALHARLANLDPQTAQRLSVNDQQRIQRALEVNILTGKTMQENFAAQQRVPLDYEVHAYGLLPAQRSDLHTKIEQRFDHMLELGLVEEVRGLYLRDDLHAQLPAIRSVGYRQVWDYLDNEIDYVQMRLQAIAATRQLAKRQLTWLRSWPDVITIDSLNDNILGRIVVDITTQ